jgi:hypothetical protein
MPNHGPRDRDRFDRDRDEPGRDRDDGARDRDEYGRPRDERASYRVDHDRGGGWGQAGMEPGRGIIGEYEGDPRWAHARRHPDYGGGDRGPRPWDEHRRETDVRRGGYGGVRGGTYGGVHDPRFHETGAAGRSQMLDEDRGWRGDEWRGYGQPDDRDLDRERGREDWSPYRYEDDRARWQMRDRDRDERGRREREGDRDDRPRDDGGPRRRSRFE